MKGFGFIDITILEQSILDDKTAFRKVKVGKLILNITSVFTEESSISDILYKIACDKIESVL